MGWSDLLRRHDVRVKTTVVGMAASLASAIVESTNVLLARLASEGFAWTDPRRASSDECLLECTLFEWFLRDAAVVRRFGGHADAIRRALAGRVQIDLQRSGLAAESFQDFDRRYDERFRQYSASLGVSASLQPLGALAWRCISGKEEPSERMTMLLSLRASAELAALDGLPESYRIVGRAPSEMAPK